MSSGPLYPELPEELRGFHPRRLFRLVGPGVIIASVTIGSGELVWASRSGAIFSYGMLWCFLYGGAFKAVQVYTASRHFTLTGEHPLQSWGRLPGPGMWFPLLVILPALGLMPIAFSAIPETLAGYIHRLVGMSPEGDGIGPWRWFEFWSNVWATLVLLVCLLLAVYSNYSVVERISLIVLGLLLLLVTLAVVIVGPDLAKVVSGLFVPRVGDYPEWFRQTADYSERFAQRSPWLEVSLYLTAVGGGAYDYIGYIGMSREKKWGLAGRPVATREQLEEVAADRGLVARARVWTRAPLVDAVSSFACVIVVTLLFAMLGAMVLYDQQAVPVENDLLGQQERFLVVLHPQLKWIYRGGVFLAFLGTLYGAFEVYRYTCGECLGVLAPGWAQRLTPSRLKLIVMAYCSLGGLTLTWLPEAVSGGIVGRLTLGSLVSGAATCGLWCFAMLWVDYTRLPKPLQMRWPLRALTALAGTAMTVLGAISIYKYFA